jgi:hypothetical protein
MRPFFRIAGLQPVFPKVPAGTESARSLAAVEDRLPGVLTRAPKNREKFDTG